MNHESFSSTLINIWWNTQNYYTKYIHIIRQIDGLVQERYNFGADALELHLTCTNLLKCLMGPRSLWQRNTVYQCVWVQLSAMNTVFLALNDVNLWVLSGLTISMLIAVIVYMFPYHKPDLIKSNCKALNDINLWVLSGLTISMLIAVICVHVSLSYTRSD